MVEVVVGTRRQQAIAILGGLFVNGERRIDFRDLSLDHQIDGALTLFTL